jgi:hypothetical protein
MGAPTSVLYNDGAEKRLGGAARNMEIRGPVPSPLDVKKRKAIETFGGIGSPMWFLAIRGWWTLDLMCYYSMWFFWELCRGMVSSA